MATITLMMIPVTGLTLGIQAVADPDLFWRALTVTPSVPMMLIAYILARSTAYRMATWLTLVISVTVTVWSIIQMPNNLVNYGYFLIPGVLASAVLSLPVASGVVSVCLVLSVALAYAFSGDVGGHPFLAGPIMLFVCFVTVLLGAQHRRGVEMDKREELEARDQRSNALLGTAFGGMAVLRDDDLIECNPGFSALFGYETDDVIGRDIQDLLPTANDSSVGDHTALHRDGSVFPVDLVSRAYEAADGRHRVLAVKDLRDRFQLQARLHQTDRMATMGQLAAGVAHEINNPLAWVVGNLALLDDAGIDLESMALIEKARDGAKRVERIVRDLQTFSRMREPAPQGVDLARSAASAANMIRHRLRDRGTLVEDVGQAPTVDGDETRIGQICLNLLVNAVESLDPERRAANRVHLSVSTDANGSAALEITDNGRGMSPAVRRRIFDPFYTTKDHGTGLGLAITRSIAEDLGATLDVESAPGVGTTMRVVFPAGQLAAPTSATPIFALGRTLAPASVLVVDDEPDICDLIEAALAGHRVVSATSVEAALEAIEIENFTVVVCDLMMPVKTGMDLFNEATTKSPELDGCFVFVTGGAYTQEARVFLDRTSAPVLEKPFRLQHMREVVEDLIPTAKRSTPPGSART